MKNKLQFLSRDGSLYDYIFVLVINTCTIAKKSSIISCEALYGATN